MPDQARERRSSRIALSCLLLAAGLITVGHVYDSWTPTDEGVIAQSAERVLAGELPHRDFIALWSGGLDLLNAAAFKVLGTTLWTLRTVLVGASLAGLAAMFFAARGFLGPWGAAALAFAAAEWTIQLSPSPLPSWYALFLTLGAIAATARFLETRRRKWLVLAGAAAAGACAVKITGLYFIGAVALLFVWLVQEETPGGHERRGLVRAYAWTITVGLCGYLALLLGLVSGMASANTALHYVIPLLALVALLMWREWRRPSDDGVARFRRLGTLVAPFAAGAIAVAAVWVAPYALSQSLGDLFTGLFVTPRLRFEVATYPLPGLRSAGIAALPFAVLLVGSLFVRRPLRAADRVALWALIVALAALTYEGSPLILIVWYAFRLMTPLCVVLGVVLLAKEGGPHAIAPDRRTLVFFLVAAAAACSLVQIPFALYTYFLYFVPILLLALAALFTAAPSMPRDVPVALLAFLLWFGFLQPGSLARETAMPGEQLAQLALPRGGIMVARRDSTEYSGLVAAIERHRPGDWIYVWHNAPQVYFLAAKRNPTRTMFEVFDDSASRTDAYLRGALERHDVRVVVLALADSTVRPLPPAFREWVDTTYPGAEWVGRWQVRWREGPPARR